jgi:hypothetical protein
MAKQICPHCFGEFGPDDAVATSYGVTICANCADGNAAWAALKEWAASPSRSFDLWMVESLGFEIAEDADQPGMWIWRHDASGDACDMSFDSREDAIADAQRAAQAMAAGEKCPWYADLKVGDEVWWNDPDHGQSSGYYVIRKLRKLDDDPVSEAATVFLGNDFGSEVEAMVFELSPKKPDGLHPVVDGDAGDGDIYGYAASKEEAIDVGNATFADEVVDAYLAHNVRLADGSIVPQAWVALTSELPDLCRIRLTLDVTYRLNGENIAEMQKNLRRMVERAIGEGLLTGETDAEVDEYSMEVKEFAAEMRDRMEAEEAYMAKRDIEAGLKLMEPHLSGDKLDAVRRVIADVVADELPFDPPQGGASVGDEHCRECRYGDVCPGTLC